MTCRLLDDTTGTIDDILYYYSPATHDAAESVIKNIPARLIVFTSIGIEDIMTLTEEAGRDLLEIPGGEEIMREYMTRVDQTNTQGGSHVLRPWLKQLQMERTRLHLEHKQDTNEYKLIDRFFKFAAYTQQVMARKLESFPNHPEDLQPLAPDRVVVKQSKGLLNPYARDPVLGLAGKDKRFLLPGSRDGFNEDFNRRIEYADYEILKDTSFSGYDVLPRLDIHSVEGGGMVANNTTLFTGINTLGMHRDKYHGKTYSNNHTKCEINKLAPGKTVFFEHSSSQEHIDMLLVPFDENRIGFANVAKTVELLHSKGIVLRPEEEIENLRLNDCTTVCRAKLKEEGYTPVDLPAIYLNYRGKLCMITGANVLMDTKNAYIPLRQECDERRFARVGKLLDEWTFDTFGKFKNPVGISGFEAPWAWESAGLRCAFNVISRS